MADWVNPLGMAMHMGICTSVLNVASNNREYERDISGTYHSSPQWPFQDPDLKHLPYVRPIVCIREPPPKI